jgi:hypothetical protein
VPAGFDFDAQRQDGRWARADDERWGGVVTDAKTNERKDAPSTKRKMRVPSTTAVVRAPSPLFSLAGGCGLGLVGRTGAEALAV